MRIDVESRDLRKLEVDLSGAPVRVQWNAGAAVARGARLVDREMRRDARGHQGNYFGKPGTSYVVPLDRHVTHEMVEPLEAEIGIEYEGAGKLAHIIVHGSVNNAPAYDYMAGPRRALPRITRDMGEAAEDSVLGDER